MNPQSDCETDDEQPTLYDEDEPELYQESDEYYDEDEDEDESSEEYEIHQSDIDFIEDDTDGQNYWKQLEKELAARGRQLLNESKEQSSKHKPLASSKKSN